MIIHLKWKMTVLGVGVTCMQMSDNDQHFQFAVLTHTQCPLPYFLLQ